MIHDGHALELTREATFRKWTALMNFANNQNKIIVSLFSNDYGHLVVFTVWDNY